MNTIKSLEAHKANARQISKNDILKIYNAIKDLWYKVKQAKQFIKDIKWYQVWKFAGLITAFFNLIKDIEDIMFNDEN